MSKQEIVDSIESCLTGVISIGLREKILDAVWQTLCDEMSEDDE